MMVDMILNSVRGFFEPLPTWRVAKGGRVEFIKAANANIARREYCRIHGLKHTHKGITTQKVSHA